MQRNGPLRTPPHSTGNSPLLDKKNHIEDLRNMLEPAYRPIPVEEKSASCRKVTGKIIYGSYLSSLLLAAAAADTITFTLGLMMQDRDFLGCIKKTDERIYALTAFYFAQYLVITAPYVNQGIKDSIEIARYRNIPLDWERLSRNKEIAAAAIGLSFAAYSVTGETTATYGFWKDLGLSPIYSGILSAFYGKTSLLSESRKAWENIRNIFIFFDQGASCSTFSFKPSKAAGYLLALFSAAGAMILGYDGITAELSVKDFGLKIFLLIFALSKGFTDMSLNGKINVDALEELFHKSTPAESKEITYPAALPFKTVAGLSSLIFGSIVTESLSMIYIDSLATAALPFGMPALVPPVLGYGIAVSQGTNVIYATYEFFNFLRKGLHAIAGKCRDRKKETPDDEVDLEMAEYKKLSGEEEKSAAIAPYSSGNSNLTFAPPRIKVTVPAETAAYRSSRCVIL